MPDRCPAALEDDGAKDIAATCWARWALQAFGWLCVGLGAIGAVLPGVPTTVFLLMAVWAFSRSSERLRQWLWTHPRFGRPIQAWHRHRVISVRAKIFALLSMSGSFAVLSMSLDSWPLIAMAAVMVPSALYVATRASVPPAVAPISQ